METRSYRCQYCKQEFIPKKRRVQKFCSDSCRVGFHRQKNKIEKKELTSRENKSLPKKTKVDQMSFAGVGNAAVGTLAVDTILSLFTKEENKPATKGDLKQFASKLERFQVVKNLTVNSFGKSPYFDNELKVLVYK
tara:strand:- start:17970 stop:18377 length:408 start_codon:yes stop_codon:yes gene_type:complete